MTLPGAHYRHNINMLILVCFHFFTSAMKFQISFLKIELNNCTSCKRQTQFTN